MYQTFLKPLAHDIKTFILDTLFPISCLACGVEGEFVCAKCKSELAKLEHQRCIVCQKPTPFGLTHPGCQTPQGADALISFYDYHDEKVSKIIIAGKYNFLPGVYKILGAMIAEKIKKDFLYITAPNQQIYPSSDSPAVALEKAGVEKINLPENMFSTSSNNIFLTPIPLHSTRKRWRGFNQAEVLCQTLSQELSLPCISVLVRCKLTRTQKDLKKDKRLKNVSDAFKLKPGTDVRGKNLILVDDVTTTGATLQEAAKVLKRNGAEKVIFLTVARD